MEATVMPAVPGGVHRGWNTGPSPYLGGKWEDMGKQGAKMVRWEAVR